MRNNIGKLYVANFLSGFVFWYAIEKLFMQQIGISALGVAVNAIVYVVVSTVLNIPSGILADKWNRKYTLMLGIVALMISTLLMSQSHGLLLYMVATGIWGIYFVMTSGTFQATMYDSLAETKQEDEYVKHQGRAYGMNLVGVSLGAVLGGYLGDHLGYRPTYLWSLIPCAVNLLVLWSMHEPVFHKEIEDTRLWQHLKKSSKLITGNQLLLYLSMLFVAASLISNTQGEYASLYYIALGFGAVGNGWATAGKWMVGSFGQFLSNKLGGYTSWCVAVLFLAFFAFTIYHSPLGIFFFYLASFLQSIVTTNVENVIQHNVSSSVRATTLSILGFCGSVLLIPLSIIYGYIAKHDVFQAYMFVAIVCFIFWIAWLFRPRSLRQRHIFQPNKAGSS